MIIKAYMLAFTGRNGEIPMRRHISIPDEYVEEDAHLMAATIARSDEQFADALLNLAWHYGQNEFQPMHCPSLSMDDIIEIKHPEWSSEDLTYWRVDGVGFTKIVWEPKSPNGWQDIEE